METLLKSTTAYKILCGDRESGRLSHAYMVHFSDVRNLKDALKLFALEFFGCDKNSLTGRRILNGSFSDCKFYPREGDKLNVDAAGEIVAESAMRPGEGGKKLFVICGIETASPLVQNKLLKTLEEPQKDIHFLLGATALAPVLETVKSRVKMLEIPAFSEREIFAALERNGQNALNAAAAKSANGILGAAQNMLEGGIFEAVSSAAKEICFNSRLGDIGTIAAKYADFKYKEELLAEMQRIYFSALTEGGELAEIIAKPALIYALEKLNAAGADLKFNAYFHGLLYDFMLEVAEENKKWRKLQA